MSKEVTGFMCDGCDRIHLKKEDAETCENMHARNAGLTTDAKDWAWWLDFSEEED